MFLFKKICGTLLLPVGLSLVFLLCGWVLLFSRRRLKIGRALVIIGFFILLLPSLDSCADLLLRPLESWHPPYKIVAQPPVNLVVVLGGGVTSGGPERPAAVPNGASLVRLAEGVRIHKLTPASKLVVSGGSVFGSAADGDALAATARGWGVNPQDILVERASLDTEDQARSIKKIAGGRSFALVTSAVHMPRAMALFRKEGLAPVAAPTDYFPGDKGDPRRFLPRVSALRKAETALYEYMGLAWAKVRGKI